MREKRKGLLGFKRFEFLFRNRGPTLAVKFCIATVGQCHDAYLSIKQSVGKSNAGATNNG
jgi:hypothetical protein